MRGVGALGVDRRLDGVARAREREEECVALRVDLDAAALGEALAHEPPMVANDLRVAIAELLQEAVEPSMSLKTNVTVPPGRATWDLCKRVAAR